ncbi:MAG: WD40/YVTN/BNR-like repeat-containing protein, partial [Myxococcales bacterium]
SGGANTAQLMWLVGEGGYVANSANRGASWTAPASPVTTRLNGVATPDGTQAFAVGQGGVILRAGGTTGGWFSDPSPVTDELHAVSCASSSSCFAVGDQATILVWNGQRFLLQERASGAGAPRYLAVHAWMEATGGRRTVVVGTGGVVRHSSTSTFATSAIAGGGTLVAVDSARSTTPGYVLAANDTGAVFRSDDGGASWSPAGSLPPGVKLTGIAIGGSGRWFASTEAHGAFTSADHGASWVPLETNFRGRFDFVYSPPGNSSWLGGAGGALLYTPYQNGL